MENQLLACIAAGHVDAVASTVLAEETRESTLANTNGSDLSNKSNNSNNSKIFLSECKDDIEASVAGEQPSTCEDSEDSCCLNNENGERENDDEGDDSFDYKPIKITFCSSKLSPAPQNELPNHKQFDVPKTPSPSAADCSISLAAISSEKNVRSSIRYTPSAPVGAATNSNTPFETPNTSVSATTSPRAIYRRFGDAQILQSNIPLKFLSKKFTANGSQYSANNTPFSYNRFANNGYYRSYARAQSTLPKGFDEEIEEDPENASSIFVSKYPRQPSLSFEEQQQINQNEIGHRNTINADDSCDYIVSGNRVSTSHDSFQNSNEISEQISPSVSSFHGNITGINLQQQYQPQAHLKGFENPLYKDSRIEVRNEKIPGDGHIIATATADRDFNTLQEVGIDDASFKNERESVFQAHPKHYLNMGNITSSQPNVNVNFYHTQNPSSPVIKTIANSQVSSSNISKELEDTNNNRFYRHQSAETYNKQRFQSNGNHCKMPPPLQRQYCSPFSDVHGPRGSPIRYYPARAQNTRFLSTPGFQEKQFQDFTFNNANYSNSHALVSNLDMDNTFTMSRMPAGFQSSVGDGTIETLNSNFSGMSINKYRSANNQVNVANSRYYNGHHANFQYNNSNTRSQNTNGNYYRNSNGVSGGGGRGGGNSGRSWTGFQLNSRYEQKGEPDACLFVASLNSQKTDQQLTESVTNHFSHWGELLNVKVMKDWMNRPYAFVQFQNVGEATLALASSHDTIIDGRHIRVEKARVNRTLFISRVPSSTSVSTFQEALERYGHLEDISFVISPHHGFNKFCAYVKYRFREDAIQGFLSLRHIYRWCVEWASNIDGLNSQPDCRCIYVDNLDPCLTNHNELIGRFSPYGNIKSILLVRNGEERSSNTGICMAAYIIFDDEHSVDIAAQTENGKIFLSRELSVYISEKPIAEIPRSYDTSVVNSYLQTPNGTFQINSRGTPSASCEKDANMYSLQNVSATNALSNGLGNNSSGDTTASGTQTQPITQTSISINPANEIEGYDQWQEESVSFLAGESARLFSTNQNPMLKQSQSTLSFQGQQAARGIVQNTDSLEKTHSFNTRNLEKDCNFRNGQISNTHVQAQTPHSKTHYSYPGFQQRNQQVIYQNQCQQQQPQQTFSQTFGSIQSIHNEPHALATNYTSKYVQSRSGNTTSTNGNGNGNGNGTNNILGNLESSYEQEQQAHYTYNSSHPAAYQQAISIHPSYNEQFLKMRQGSVISQIGNVIDGSNGSINTVFNYGNGNNSKVGSGSNGTFMQGMQNNQQVKNQECSQSTLRMKKCDFQVPIMAGGGSQPSIQNTSGKNNHYNGQINYINIKHVGPKEIAD